LEHEIWQQIHPRECVKQRWSKGDKLGAPNIHKMINRFNLVSQWVTTEIVKVEELKPRAVMLNRFLFIAQKCRELNNYNAVMEILSALNNTSVHRLRQTWELLPEKSLEVWDSLATLMDGVGNFASYRAALRKSKGGVVPYLGLYLTDLTFIDDGNLDSIESPNGTKMINFSKLSLVASVIRDMKQYSETPYNLERIEFIQDYLKSRPIIDDPQELYDLSCQREERIKKKPKSNTITANPLG